MTVEEASRRLRFMQEFRVELQEFLAVKRQLRELKEYAEQNSYMSHFNTNDVERKYNMLMPEYQDRRSKVARHIVEATEITNSCGVPSQLQIMPPRLIGGYAQQLNLYQAAIQDELPFEFEIPIQKLSDVVDQTVFACERIVDESQNLELNSPSKLSKVPSAVGRGFGELFKTDVDKAIIKWAIIVLLVVVILRLCGVPVQKIGELVASWFKK